MKESDYNLATDMRAVHIANYILGQLLPENNPSIEEDEKKTVMRLLQSWNDRMYERLKESHAPNND